MTVIHIGTKTPLCLRVSETRLLRVALLQLPELTTDVREDPPVVTTGGRHFRGDLLLADPFQDRGVRHPELLR